MIQYWNRGSRLKLSYFVIFLMICSLLGAGGYYLFHLDFWVSGGIAAAALLLNGAVAAWEDRKIR